MAEGIGMRGGYSTPEALASRHRCRVALMTLRESPFAHFQVSYEIEIPTNRSLKQTKKVFQY